MLQPVSKYLESSVIALLQKYHDLKAMQVQIKATDKEEIAMKEYIDRLKNELVDESFLLCDTIHGKDPDDADNGSICYPEATVDQVLAPDYSFRIPIPVDAPTITNRENADDNEEEEEENNNTAVGSGMKNSTRHCSWDNHPIIQSIFTTLPTIRTEEIKLLEVMLLYNNSRSMMMMTKEQVKQQISNCREVLQTQAKCHHKMLFRLAVLYNEIIILLTQSPAKITIGCAIAPADDDDNNDVIYSITSAMSIKTIGADDGNESSDSSSDSDEEEDEEDEDED